ncbi:MAG TPA: NF038122 family metalloprotease [Pyrinomonadaceae bacterium]|nr:NF038122 family metalloprotease [Pyrinomonadaceae bacterium]
MTLVSGSPRFARNPYARLYSPSLSGKFRSLLALGLAALMLAAPLSFAVPAQSLKSDSATAVSPKTGAEAPGKAFILYENAGGIGCRDATLAERGQILKSPSGQKLRQINHLKDGDNYTFGEEGNGPGLKIILMATQQLENNQVAKQAFIAAAAHWEAIVQTPMTVYIDVDYGPLNFGQPWSSPLVLGSTGSPSVFRGYSAVRTNLLAEAANSGNAKSALFNLLPASFIPTELGDGYVMTVNASIARAIGLIPANADPNDPRPSIGFNSAKPFDFDPNPMGPGGPGCGNSGIDCNKTDFDAVATHEIGHALGFTSNNGASGEPPNMEVWDLFRFKPGVTNFTTNQRIMTASGTQVFYDGGSELGLSTGGPDGDSPNGDGEQSSHWREDGSQPANNIGIMDPTIASGVRQTITNNDKRALNAFGYNLDNNTAPPPAPPATPPPANDNFTSATTLSGCSGTVTGTNLEATKETGEPNHAPDNGGGLRSVWFRWTAPSTGSATFTTKGSSYDTVLGIYTGSSVGGLTVIGKNDDVTLGVVTSSTLTFNAVAGTTYMIAVDGYNNGGAGGDMGNVKLNWSEANCTVTVTNDIQLSQDSYSFSEADINTAQGFGILSVNVTRGDPNAGPATVQYFTEDAAGGNECDKLTGQASQRCDYAAQAGTLRFATGEATKQIQIPIINDGYNEGNETLLIKLQNAVGATLGRSQATITIQDSAVVTTPTQNRYLNNSFFVRMNYLDFLGREPDAAGFADWTTVLNNCGSQQGFLGAPPDCDRAHVSHGFFASPESIDRGFLIYRMYEVGMNRLPKYVEFTPDMASLSGFGLSDAVKEQNLSDYLQQFTAKQEFQTRFAGALQTTEAAALIQKLEQTAGVTLPATATTKAGQPTQYGRQELINLRASGTFTVGQTLKAFVEQQAVYDLSFPRGQVTLLYFAYLKRDPDLNDPNLVGWKDWVDVFTNGRQSVGVQPKDIHHLIFGFIYSEEYRKRFGQP